MTNKALIIIKGK